jgi:hypothetical protein
MVSTLQTYGEKEKLRVVQKQSKKPFSNTHTLLQANIKPGIKNNNNTRQLHSIPNPSYTGTIIDHDQDITCAYFKA